MNLSEAFGIDTGKLFEITFTLVLVYLVLRNASGFSSAIKGFGSAYSGFVKVLQGR